MEFDLIGGGHDGRFLQEHLEKLHGEVGHTNGANLGAGQMKATIHAGSKVIAYWKYAFLPRTSALRF